MTSQDVCLCQCLRHRSQVCYRHVHCGITKLKRDIVPGVSKPSVGCSFLYVLLSEADSIESNIVTTDKVTGKFPYPRITIFTTAAICTVVVFSMILFVNRQFQVVTVLVLTLQSTARNIAFSPFISFSCLYNVSCFSSGVRLASCSPILQFNRYRYNQSRYKKYKLLNQSFHYDLRKYIHSQPVLSTPGIVYLIRS